MIQYKSFKNDSHHLQPCFNRNPFLIPFINLLKQERGSDWNQEFLFFSSLQSFALSSFCGPDQFKDIQGIEYLPSSAPESITYSQEITKDNKTKQRRLLIISFYCSFILAEF